MKQIPGIFFNTGLIFAPDVVILCKTLVGERAKERDIFIYLLIYSNKLAHLQLITVLVYGCSPPKNHGQDY